MQYIHKVGSNSDQIHYILYKYTAIFREDVCTQLTACRNHIQFFYIEVRLWADNKFQNQLLTVQTILTVGINKLGNLGGGTLWATLPATGNIVRHMIINLTKLCWQAKSSGDSLSSITWQLPIKRCLGHYSLSVSPVYYIYMCSVHMCIKT